MWTNSIVSLTVSGGEGRVDGCGNATATPVIARMSATRLRNTGTKRFAVVRLDFILTSALLNAFPAAHSPVYGYGWLFSAMRSIWESVSGTTFTPLFVIFNQTVPEKWAASGTFSATATVASWRLPSGVFHSKRRCLGMGPGAFPISPRAPGPRTPGPAW